MVLELLDCNTYACACIRVRVYIYVYIKNNRNEILKEVEAMQATTLYKRNVVELAYEVTNTYINNVNNSVMKNVWYLDASVIML